VELHSPENRPQLWSKFNAGIARGAALKAATLSLGDNPLVLGDTNSSGPGQLSCFLAFLGVSRRHLSAAPGC
jgi:hypothetical protein